MHDFIGARNVINADRLKELSARSEPAAWFQLVSHFGAIIVTACLMFLTTGTLWSVPLFLIQGMLINFLYAPEHECDHFTAFRSRAVNLWTAAICGFFIFFNNEMHRWSHYQHHRNTQDWDNDPEINERGIFTTPWQYFSRLLGFGTLWSGRIRPLIMHSMGTVSESYITDKQKHAIVITARLYMVGYTAIMLIALLMQSWWPIYYWVGPFLAMRWTYWLQGIGEHTGLTHENNTLDNTRTLKTNAIMRWLNWNMTYHTVHHTYPGVPFYRLPELHREVEQKLGRKLPADSYLALHFKHLKLLASGKSELEICNQHATELQRRRSGQKTQAD